MIIICFILLVGIIIFKPNILEKKNNDENRFSGFDERLIDNYSEVNSNQLREIFNKFDLLKLLESDLLDENQKLSIIYRTAFFDDFNPTIIKAYNLTKGLKW